MQPIIKITILTFICFFMRYPHTYATISPTNVAQQNVSDTKNGTKISFFQALKMRRAFLKELKKNATDKKDLITGLVFLGIAILSFSLLGIGISNILDAIIFKILFFVAGIVFLILGLVYLIRAAASSSSKYKAQLSH
jgi:sulfite exporter TauE/SafE